MKKAIFLFIIFIFTIMITGCNNPNNQNEKVNEIIQLIDNLPTIDEISLEHDGDVIYIKLLYSELTDEEKQLVTNYDKLLRIDSKLLVLKNEYEILINGIIELIDELPVKNKVTLNHESLINEIEAILITLTEEDINLITNIDKYYQAKEKIEQLKEKQLIENEAKEIKQLIKNLPNADELKLEDENIVLEVRNKYDQARDEVKQLIDNYNKLDELYNLINVMKKYNDFNPNDILDKISDYATEETNDKLITNTDEYTVTYTSSNEDLYYIENGYTKIRKIYQMHKNQVVTVSAEVLLHDGYKMSLTKEVTVGPIVFEKIGSTPVATYFQTSALASYTNHSQRYKEEKTLFSDKAKEALDIIYYAFATITSTGGINLTDFNVLEELIKLRENDVRVIMCLAGVSSSASRDFATITSNDSLRKKFVTNIMDAVDKYHFDGVDIDWESTSDYKVIPENMNKLAKDLKEEMNRRQDKKGTPYLLSAAIPSTSWGAGTDRFDFATLNKYLDYVNMMSYDLNNPDKSTHVSALYSSNYDKGYGFSVQWGVNLFTSRGLDKNKIIIGSAGYGKAYKVNNPNLNTKFPGIGLSAKLIQIPGMDGSFASGTVFLNVIDSLLATGKYEKYIEYNTNNQVVGSYLFNKDENIFVTYESEEVMKAKYEFASSVEGMGIMCWAYTEDTRDTYVNTIYDNLTNK